MMQHYAGCPMGEAQSKPASDKEMVEAVTLDEKLIARLRDGQSPSALDYKRLLFLASQGIRRSPADDTQMRVVPWQPEEYRWRGLARDIVMWMDMYDGSRQTPRNLFNHLERCGTPIPDWLRDEPELKALDHVPSRSSCAVIIYKAMLSAVPPAPGSKG